MRLTASFAGFGARFSIRNAVVNLFATWELRAITNGTTPPCTPGNGEDFRTLSAAHAAIVWVTRRRLDVLFEPALTD